MQRRSKVVHKVQQTDVFRFIKMSGTLLKFVENKFTDSIVAVKVPKRR